MPINEVPDSEKEQDDFIHIETFKSHETLQI
jgi:hypothetical protein